MKRGQLKKYHTRHDVIRINLLNDLQDNPYENDLFQYPLWVILIHSPDVFQAGSFALLVKLLPRANAGCGNSVSL
jgi:hypothetical protein